MYKLCVFPSFQGGIFWQLRSAVDTQASTPFDAKQLVTNPWMQLFIHGIDDKQPLLEALEKGVNNQGSQPLFDLFRNETSLDFIRTTAKCAVSRMNLNEKNYPDFGVRPGLEQEKLLGPPSDVQPYPAVVDTLGTIIGLLQQVDYQYMKRDKAYLESLRENKGKPVDYWLHIIEKFGKDIVNPFMTCAKYPGYPLSGRRLLSETNENAGTRTGTGTGTGDNPRPQSSSPVRAEETNEGGAQQRKLITVDDKELAEQVYSVMGGDFKDIVAVTQRVLDQLQKCENQGCKWIGEKYQGATKLGSDVYVSVTTIVSILGALYFLVANVGFSSYDALLTFPQERALLNRESANGLYGVSSYFIAKNLADLPFQIVPSLFFVTIYYFFVGLGSTVMQYVVYLAVMSSVTFAAYGFGYLASAATPKMEIAILVAPVVLVIWLTIGGFFLKDDQIPSWIHWFSYLSFYKWGFFSLVTNTFPPSDSFGVLPNRVPLAMAGITDTRLFVTISSIVALGVGYRVLAFFALKYTNRSVGLQSQ